MIDHRYTYVVGQHHEIKRYVLDQMHSERRRCLVDKLKWDLETVDGLEVDQFDGHETIYVIVLEDGSHASSLRLHKSSLRNSLMNAISQGAFADDCHVWELSRFVSSNFSFSSCEYLVFSAAFHHLLKLGVGSVFVTLTPAIARMYRMLGIQISPAGGHLAKSEGHANYELDTSPAAFEKFCRKAPQRDALRMRLLGQIHEKRMARTGLDSLPYIAGGPKSLSGAKY